MAGVLCTLLVFQLPALSQSAAEVDLAADPWRKQFAVEVDRQLEVPVEDQQRYLALLELALMQANLTQPTPQTVETVETVETAQVVQAVVLVDRNPNIQAAFVVLGTPGGYWSWLGASAISTGKTGSYEHFLTPTGVFPHTLDNPDFRSEGTRNKFRIRGYGVRGLRVFDFGWQMAERGWGVGGTSQMRLQMHATDPDRLESRLGSVQSEGCIRISAKLNSFLDSHGILDASYQKAIADGQDLWVIKPNQQTIATPGRYLVIVDSQSTERPAWADAPAAKVLITKR
ncbi:MAG: L,D-transpeptidase [Rhodoferax sp.]|nr:L,D-transpeptidase [Rhodoferax sp.]